MIINEEMLQTYDEDILQAYDTKHVKFISYTGRYPNLCSGDLTLEIDGERVVFDKYEDRFWHSGGSCEFRHGYSESYYNQDEWELDAGQIPEKYRKYAHEINLVFNANVEFGCCGGCLRKDRFDEYLDKRIRYTSL